MQFVHSRSSNNEIVLVSFVVTRFFWKVVAKASSDIFRISILDSQYLKKQNVIDLVLLEPEELKIHSV